MRRNRTPGRQSQGKADGVTPVGFFFVRALGAFRRMLVATELLAIRLLGR
jgi:hypothetical protein